MSIQQIRKSALIGAGIVVLGLVGLFAGRLSAGAFPHGRHSDFGAHVFGRISQALNLTEDQKTQVKTILKTHAPEIEAQIRASASARRAVHDAVLAQPLDETAIRAAAEKLGQVHADGAVLFAKIRTEVQPILTEEQRAKIQTFRDRMRNKTESSVKSFEALVGSGS